jgi:aspartyl protease family protein
MGRPFTQRLEIARSAGRKHARIDALIDTGATFTWIPEDVLEGLGVRREQRRRFEFADGRSEYYDMGTAWVRLDGWQGLTPVVFGNAGSASFVGCATLDDFSLAVDPVNERLLPVPARE